MIKENAQTQSTNIGETKKWLFCHIEIVLDANVRVLECFTTAPFLEDILY